VSSSHRTGPSARDVWDAVADPPLDTERFHDLDDDAAIGEDLAGGWGDERLVVGAVEDGAVEDGAEAESDHRGAFGEFGGESAAFIERTFRERIVLVGVQHPGQSLDEVDELLDELALLVDTAGADPIARVVQRRDRPDPATFLGKGKVDELAALARATDCDTVVFDEELSPAQQRNLEKILGRTAIDRTAVILDIFAQNADTQEGRAQVELALLRYRLPRLRGKGTSLSQQGGGVGTRMGGGETKLEVDRRRIVRRIHHLEAELTRIDAHRATQRKARERNRIRHVAIVGYTNAGKSTLLNRLTDAGVLTEDRLFATLDATTRRYALPGGEPLLVTDTVGFVRKLPHHLVEAFKSTLQVAAEADLLVHLVDATAPDVDAQFRAVRGVLDEIGAAEVPEIIGLNKVDALEPADRARLVSRLEATHGVVVALSARTGAGIDALVAAIGDGVHASASEVELFVPYARADLLAAVHREGEVLSEEAGDEGMRVVARLEPASVGRFASMVVPS
jgi:GTP-binding protein HflX